MHDLSEIRATSVNPTGLYRDDRLRTYLEYEEHEAFFIQVDQEIAGFALIRKPRPGTHLLGEFFILRKFRRSGIGKSAAAQLIEMFPGNWEIPFQLENVQAANFWRNSLKSMGFNATELVPLVDIELEVSADTLLTFSNSNSL